MIFGDYVSSNASLRYTNAQSSYTFRTGSGALAIVQTGEVQATSLRWRRLVRHCRHGFALRRQR